jgi:hypothetical protein
MQLGMDILKFLFFPGLLFTAVCGGFLLMLEGWLQVAFYGGDGPRLRNIALGETVKESISAAELTVLAVALAAMGLSGVLLVGVRGDLFLLALLFVAAEMLPLYLMAARGEKQALHVPLLFRTALCRMVALLCVAVSISLRFPGEFSPGLETLRGEGAPLAAQLWGGLGFAFITVSLACAGLAYFLFLLGRPAGTKRYGMEEASSQAAFGAAAIEGPHRAVSILLGVVLFLGYPWEGGRGVLLWSAAVAGTAAAVTLIRAWAEGRGSVFIRWLQGSAAILALLSVVFAFAAVIVGRS